LIRELTLKKASPEAVFVRIKEFVFLKKNWSVVVETRDALKLRTGVSFASFGEWITVRAEPVGDATHVIIGSFPVFLLDFGKSTENVQKIEKDLVRIFSTN
jgi:hypothetical protein